VEHLAANRLHASPFTMSLIGHQPSASAISGIRPCVPVIPSGELRQDCQQKEGQSAVRRALLHLRCNKPRETDVSSMALRNIFSPFNVRRPSQISPHLMLNPKPPSNRTFSRSSNALQHFLIVSQNRVKLSSPGNLPSPTSGRFWCCQIAAINFVAGVFPRGTTSKSKIYRVFHPSVASQSLIGISEN
jgi:hypothetical protein